MTEKQIWSNYVVRLEVLDRIYGGLPKNPELIEGFLKGKGVPDEAAKEMAPKIAAEIAAENVETEERMWTTFKRDAVGLYIETRQIKALLKEAVGETEMWKQQGLAGLKSRVGGAVFPKGQGGADQTRLYLFRNGTAVKDPDGFDETVGHVSGPQGKRSILKRKDYVLKPTIEFTLRVANPRVKGEILRTLFEVGEELGLGADRSQEHGKFKVLEFAEVEQAE